MPSLHLHRGSCSSRPWADIPSAFLSLFWAGRFRVHHGATHDLQNAYGPLTGGYAWYRTASLHHHRQFLACSFELDHNREYHRYRAQQFCVKWESKNQEFVFDWVGLKLRRPVFPRHLERSGHWGCIGVHRRARRPSRHGLSAPAENRSLPSPQPPQIR
ncbi:hypothetical protein BCR34DRAFT_295237 [Clohesyomyces aquaticus]|uniref:Uncharacterized protein n=1 Tax=Clohesyomyces aquaticus TaxID=1231657 RepID=A0A1Y2A8K3_9PLEO|nr:hypothetical protein BCR34DRAFT_295237 [Clohesyomyces aquaticus]